MAGAFFIGVPFTSPGQVVPPPGSEVPIPPKPKTDSASPKPDTIKPPFGRGIAVGTADIGPRYSWNRDELFASGALSLADLLEQIPGVTSFRSGWLASPKLVAYNGDLNRVRVYYDGISLDNLDARTSPMLDLNTVPLWTLEAVSVERLGGELRVNVRSWQPQRTSPYTRTDLTTGNEDTNIYRGFYGKRFKNAAGLQLAGQQFNTSSARFGGGGDGLSYLVRVGTATKRWSVDAYGIRSQTTRVLQPTFGAGLSVPPYSGNSTLAYLRGAVGNVNGGPWIEVIASTMKLQEGSRHTTASAAPGLKVIPDTADTTTSRQQYVMSGGFTRGALKASVTDRIRRATGETSHAPGGRFIFDTDYAFLSVFGEHDDFGKVNRLDAVARWTPLPYIAVAGAVSRVTSTITGADPPPGITAARVEGGVRIFGPWLLGGFITRDTAILPPPRVFDSAYVARGVARRSGSYIGLRGKVYKDIGADIVATMWASADSYRPKYQARSELNIITRWFSRFPSGSFGLRASVVHEYRGNIVFPTDAGVRTAFSSNIFTGLLEIKILRGIVSYQVRNLAGELYQVIPDFYMPRAVSIYGIRWEFWN